MQLFLIATSILAASCGQDVGGASGAATVQRGLDALAAGDTGSAVHQFVSVLEADPDNELALYNLGHIAQTNRDLGSAEEYYRAVLDEDPRFEAALFNLALLREAAGGTQEAIELYREVLAVNANNAEAHMNLGLLLLAAERTGEASEEIRAAVQLDPSLVDRLEGGKAAGTPPSPATAPDGKGRSGTGG